MQLLGKLGWKKALLMGMNVGEMEKGEMLGPFFWVWAVVRVLAGSKWHTQKRGNWRDYHRGEDWLIEGTQRMVGKSLDAHHRRRTPWRRKISGQLCMNPESQLPWEERGAQPKLNPNFSLLPYFDVLLVLYCPNSSRNQDTRKPGRCCPQRSAPGPNQEVRA